MDKNVKEYWNKTYNILLKERSKHIQEMNNHYQECLRLQKEVDVIDSSLNKLLEMGSELHFIEA